MKVHLLPLLTVVGVATAIPTSFEDLADNVKNKWKQDKFVKKNYKDLLVQATGGEIVTRCGKKINLQGLQRSHVLSDQLACEVDGHVVSCPPSNILRKTQGDTKITVFTDTNVFGRVGPNRVKSIQVIDPDPNCDTIEVFEEVEPGMVTSVPPEAFDENELKKMLLADTVWEETRNLRSSNKNSTQDVTSYLNQRKLQSCPPGSPVQKVVKLGLAIDSAYCAYHGGKDQAITALLDLVTMANGMYEASACMTIEVATPIQVFCNSASDPFENDGADVESGCSGNGLLQAFSSYWASKVANKVDSDLQHLASGQDFIGSTVGCAYSRVSGQNGPVCRNKRLSVGVNQLNYRNSNLIRSVILAHEMGHNLGSPHDEIDDSNTWIMEPFVSSGSSGFSPFSNTQFDIYGARSCLDDFSAPTPTDSPTKSPTESPTNPPTSSPTASPTDAGDSGPYMESLVANVGRSWKTVNFANTYTLPVAVCSIRYVTVGVPLVVRMGNVRSGSMQIRLQNPGDEESVPTRDVNCMVVEEGTWKIGGTFIEAKRYQSSSVSYKNSWNGETQSYGANFGSTPVVIGQVMSFNNADWSVFWSSGSSRTSAPTSNEFKTGYHVGEDTDRTRAPEVLGHIVIEPGHVGSGTSEVEAGRTGDSIRGIETSNDQGYTYSYSQAFPSTPQVLIASQVGMDGNDGGWAVFYEDSNDPQTATSIRLAIEEDQIRDSERRHTTEQVAYMAFASVETFTLESLSS